MCVATYVATYCLVGESVLDSSRGGCHGFVRWLSIRLGSSGASRCLLTIGRPECAREAMVDASRQTNARIETWLVPFLALFTLVIFGVDLVTPLGITVTVPYVSIVLVSSIFLPRPLHTAVFATACSGLTILGFFLSPARGRCTTLGGTISVDSEVGRGSIFRVWVPDVPAHAAADQQTH